MIYVQTRWITVFISTLHVKIETNKKKIELSNQSCCLDIVFEMKKKIWLLGSQQNIWVILLVSYMFVLRFYGPINPNG